MASIRYFLALYPFPVAELLIASCIALLAFALASRSRGTPSRPLAPDRRSPRACSLYVAVFGVPRIVPVLALVGPHLERIGDERREIGGAPQRIEAARARPSRRTARRARPARARRAPRARGGA